MSLNQVTIAKTLRVANFEGKLENNNCFDFLNTDTKK